MRIWHGRCAYDERHHAGIEKGLGDAGVGAKLLWIGKMLEASGHQSVYYGLRKKTKTINSRHLSAVVSSNDLFGTVVGMRRRPLYWSQGDVEFRGW